MQKNGKFGKIKTILIASVVFGLYAAGCGRDGQVVIPKLEDLAFAQAKLELMTNERKAVKISFKPASARPFYEVKFNASAEGIIEITEISNDGCVLTGKRSGSVVLIAKAGGYTAYLEVLVSGDAETSEPYIQVPTQVVEMMAGQRRTVQVNLFNGSAADQQQFKWAVELGKDNISISPTGNTVVIQGIKQGSQKVIVTHDKSEFPAEILVFVIGQDEKVNYITTAQNVILMKAGGSSVSFSVTLVNGGPTDSAGFSFRAVEDDPCIDILSSNNTCTVMAKWKGTAVIRAQHPYAEYPLDVRVIVTDGEETYLELDRTFLLLDSGQSGFINASMAGNFREGWNADFSYKLTGDDCVEVSQTNGSFYVAGKKAGKTIMEVKNENIQYSKEALIVVRALDAKPADEYYITTSQNVIQMEVGQKYPAQLNIQLINGNNADKASFEWLVDDGRVIEVEALDLLPGKNVIYEAGIRNRAQSEIKDVANTLALITARKAGIAKITVSHPKSLSKATVIVKVYPKDTFASPPVILEAEEPKSGLIKVDTTIQKQQNKDMKVTLKMTQGDINSIGDLIWKLGDDTLAALLDMKRLENYIHGLKKGITRLAVENMNLRNPYEAVVMVGTTEELAMVSALYVDQVYQTVLEGQSIQVQVKNSNDDAALAKNDKYTIGIYDKTKFQATMINSKLLIQGLQATNGPIELSIGNTASGDIYPARVMVTVLPAETTLSRPYTLTGPSFVGMNYNGVKDVSVVLTDAGAVEKDRVQWSSENAAVVKVTGNGEKARFTAGQAASQANITVSHNKSANDKIIVAYVVPPGVDPESAVVLGIEKNHWLIKPKEEIILSIITNADESAARNIKDITWSVDNKDVVELDGNGSKALARGGKSGSAVITVSHPKKVIDLKIYVSVSDMPPLAKQITLPGIVEMLIGENKVVTAVTSGLTDDEIKNITWSVDDAKIVGISGEGAGLSGGKVFLQGKDRGQAWLTARQDSLGYQKKILVVCARTYEELMSTYVMASEESYYKLKVGDSRDIKMIFGSAGFPESKKQQIKWKAEANNVVNIYDGGGGDHAKIEAAALGITTVTIEHQDVLKPVSIIFETYTETPASTNYVMTASSLMMGLVIKKTGDQENSDNTKILTIGINPDGPSYESVEPEDYYKDGDGVFETYRTGKQFKITALGKGQSYLTIKHPQVAENIRVLVYTASSKEELDAMFPIALSKPNYLLTMGDPVSQYIRIETPPESAPGYADKIQKISWSVDTQGIVNYTISADRKEVKMDGMKIGNCVFTIRYDGVVVERAYVSVRAAAMDMTKKIVTENIIGMAPGDKNRKTSIGSNLTTEEKKKLEWRTTNPGVVSIAAVDGDFTSQYLNAVSPGEAEVIVTYDKQIERFIKVYVNADLQNYRALNLDNRYYQLRKNDEMTLTAFHAAKPSVSNDIWAFTPLDNKVVEIEPVGKDKVRVKGINEGLAAIVVRNSDYAFGNTPMTDARFIIEVNNTAPLIEDVKDDWYMTAVKTVYALDPAKTMDWVRVKVNGVRFPAEELTQIKWRVVSEEINGVKKELQEGESSQLVDIYPQSGTFVDIAPKNRKGTAILEAAHPRSVNKSVEITVICDAESLVYNPVPHIVSDKEVIKIQKYDYQTFAVKIEDLPGGYDPSLFTVESDNPLKVSVSVIGGQVTVKGSEFGQAMVTVGHPSVPDITKKIVVMVVGSGELIYLTTRDNFVVLEKGQYQAVEVQLVGFEDINNRNFIWMTEDGDVVSVNDSGRTAVITAKNTAKTAKITVMHMACPEYPLNIYVRVTEQSNFKPVYITTDNNILLIKEGNSMQVKANLVNGEEREYSDFQWSTGDKGLVDLNFSGNTAMIKGVRPGTAQVMIWHPSSLNSVNIIVIIEPPEPANGIYITTDSLLVELGTTEKQRLLRARLVNGTTEDIYGLQWTVTQHKSDQRKSDGTSFQVISMNANADMCYVSPRQEGGVTIEGEAILTVTHPKTSYRLDIKVLVKDDTDIQFSQVYLTMDQFTQKTVTVSAGSSSKIGYSSTNNAVATVEGTARMCVINAKGPGTAVIIASNMSGTKSAELIVNVKAVDLNNYFYLSAPTNIVTLSTKDSCRLVTGSVIDSKTGQKNDFLTSQLKWKIKESDQAKGVVWLNNLSSPAAVVSFENVNIYPKKAGEIELVFGFFQAGDPLFEQYPTLAASCAGKSIYVKVEQSDTNFQMSHAVVSMKEGEIVDGVWAKITPEPVTGVNYGDWMSGGDIAWRSEKPEVVSVIYRNDANRQSNVSLAAYKPGSAQIYVTYQGTQQVIAVVVSANSFIASDMVRFEVMPGVEEVFTITSNPSNSPITMTIESNQHVQLKGRQKNSSNTGEWMDMPAQFVTLAASQAGQTDPLTGLPLEGYQFQAVGTNTEGVTTITFEMKATGQKLQVTITNKKNYSVRWKDKTQMRFSPGETDTQKLRLYYSISPKTDRLRAYTVEGKFRIVPGESGDDKWIDFVRPYITGSNTVAEFFGTCGMPVSLRTETTNVVIRLDVFIYSENVPVSWNMSERTYINTNLGDRDQWMAKNLMSSYDKVNFAAVVANNEQLSINFSVPESYKGSDIKLSIENPTNFKPPLSVSINAEGTGVILKWDPGTASSTAYATYVKDLSFVDALKINYSYYNGFDTPVKYTRYILVYTQDVVRTTK